MNCKPGDIAVIVADPHCGGVDIGRLVDVERLAEPGLWRCRSIGGPLTWAYVHRGQDPRVGDIPDAWLRPIRDQDGDDETLTWADKPQEVTA